MSSTTLTLYSSLRHQNSTSGPVSEDTDTWKFITSPRIIFLSIFVLFGMLGNMCLMITICHSRRFRTTAFYIFIINLTVVNMCECLLNMAILMSTSIRNAWTYGDILCRLNAFFIHAVSIETLLSLTILTTDRMVAVKYRDKYEKVISLARFLLLIGFSWIQSLAFSLPIAIGTVHSSVYENINYCTIAKQSSVIYCASLTFFCYIVPLILCICFFICIVKTWYKDRFAVRALLARNNYDENANEEPRIRREICYSNLSATVCLSWLVLEGPYVVTTIYKLFQTSAELESLTYESLQYVWHVDLVLLFMKFSYVLVLPVAAFIWAKELRKELRDIVLCTKNNAVVDASIKKCKIEVQKLKNVREEEKPKETLSQQKEQRVFQVPVLFATSHGVHIKTAAPKSKTDEPAKVYENAEITGTKCDVTGSRNNLHVLGDDTSDYDSGNEMDPFSISHPVSFKQLNNSCLTNKQRSQSQPEVRERANKKREYKSSAGSTSAGDSGLDLTIEYNSMSRSDIKENKEHSILSIKEPQSSKNRDIFFKMNENETVEESITNVKENVKDNTESIVRSPSKRTSKVDTVGETEIKANDMLQTNSAIKCELYKLSDTKSVVKHSKQEKHGLDTIPPRRKKKRREKLVNNGNETSYSPVLSPALSLKRPPRLAPITSCVPVVKSHHSSLIRSDSSCSNQSSLFESKTPSSVKSNNPVTDIGTATHSNLSLSLNTSNVYSHSNIEWSSSTSVLDRGSEPCLNVDSSSSSPSYSGNIKANLMTLDCKMPLNSVHQDVLTPSDCHVAERLPGLHEISTRNNGGNDPSVHEHGTPPSAKLENGTLPSARLIQELPDDQEIIQDKQ